MREITLLLVLLGKTATVNYGPKQPGDQFALPIHGNFSTIRCLADSQ